MRMLVSVRDVTEALDAATAGADFIDLKEPSAGALGAVPLVEIRAICTALRQTGGRFAISATIGDIPAHAIDTILSRVGEVWSSGVDLVKVGVPGHGKAVLPALAALARLPVAVVPVLLADEGLDAEIIDAACSPLFAAVMADTQGKVGGSLLDFVSNEALESLITSARVSGVPVGLAGALRIADLPRLAHLMPDFAGFRTAVCDGSRSGRLSSAKIVRLRASLLEAMEPAGAGTC